MHLDKNKTKQISITDVSFRRFFGPELDAVRAAQPLRCFSSEIWEFPARQTGLDLNATAAQKPVKAAGLECWWVGLEAEGPAWDPFIYSELKSSGTFDLKERHGPSAFQSTLICTLTT